MVDVNLVSAKLRELAEKIARVRNHCPPDAAALAADQDALELVAFNLMLGVQTCSDIASHLIADEGWPASPTLSKAFQELHRQGVLTEEVAAALGRAAGFRNRIAHGYADTDPLTIHGAAANGLPDLERFAAEVSAWISRRA
jgi:uncharacterized protein YutE (UPF0331/DUF86 family)